MSRLAPKGSREDWSLAVLSPALDTRSRKLLRISSSLAFVASFKLIKSVALSLLLRLSWAISFCSDVAMLVRLMI